MKHDVELGHNFCLVVFEEVFYSAYLHLFPVEGCHRGINCQSGSYLSLGGLLSQAHQLRLH